MTTHHFDHSDFLQNIDAYLAGGLDGAERAAFEMHAAACEACAVLLAAARQADGEIDRLFADVRPRADFEDRLLGRLRDLPSRRRHGTLAANPVFRRLAIGVAAVILLGGFGYVAQTALNNGGLPSFSLRPAESPPAVAAAINFMSEQAALKSPPTMPSSATVSSPAPTDEREVRNSPQLPQLTAPEELASRYARDILEETPSSDVPDDADETSYAYRQPAADEDAGWAAQQGKGQGLQQAQQQAAGAAPVDELSAVPVPAAEPEAILNYRKLSVADGNVALDPSGPGAGARPGIAGQEWGGVEDLYIVPERVAQTQSGPEHRYFELTGTKEGRDINGLMDASAREETRARGRGENGVVLDERLKELSEGQTANKNAAVRENDQAGKQPSDEKDNYLLPTDDAAEPPTAPTEAKKPAATTSPAPTQQPAPKPPVPAAQQLQPITRKVIRNGEMTFEVDSFDSALLQISKLVQEEGGFVSTTDSEKLPNGKVKGTIIVRVPPDRLDTLVLKFRGLGDLKNSKIAAQDITKQYTDLASQLRAGRAMEERLLEIIKTGKGEIKDLLEAEKQLGVWREKIERLEGEIRYYDNLVSLSTLTVTLMERELRTSALLSETETVDMGIEAEDVEEARAEAIAAIDAAKGRIVQSDLKRHDAGQYIAHIEAEVAPDAAGPLIDRLKQLGRVGRLEIQRRQSTAEGAPPLPNARVERKDTRLVISLYNLANIAPRISTSLNLAAPDVEKAYAAILEQVTSADGRVVTSQLNRPRPDQTSGTIVFEIPAPAADVLLGAVRGEGEVMRLDVTQNPDTQNTTDAKRGFSVQIYSLASVAPRETTSLTIAAQDVPETFNALRNAIGEVDGRVLSTQLNEQDAASITGQLDFEVSREDLASIEVALSEAGQVMRRQVSRSADTENTVDSKVRLQVVFLDEARINPRETVSMQLAVLDVPDRFAKLLDTLRQADARVIESRLIESERSQVTGTLVFDIRRTARAAVDKALTDSGDVVSRNVTRSNDTQNTLDDKVRLSVNIADADLLPPRETTTLGLETKDVTGSLNQLKSTALSLGGRVVDSTLTREKSGREVGRIIVDVPLNKSMEMISKATSEGRIQVRHDTRNEQVPAGTLSRARVEVTLANADLLVESDKTLGSSIRSALGTSIEGLLWSIQLIIVGLCLVLPWVLLIWAAWRWIARAKRKDDDSVTPTTAPPTPA